MENFSLRWLRRVKGIPTRVNHERWSLRTSIFYSACALGVSEKKKQASGSCGEEPLYSPIQLDERAFSCPAHN